MITYIFSSSNLLLLCILVLLPHVLGYNMSETFLKREKERARDRKQKEKAARRLERKDEKSRRDPSPQGEDPDLAGIQPGPQPKIDW